MKHLCTVNVRATLVYLTDPASSQEAGLHDISAEVLQFILTQLLQASDQFGVTIEQKDTFLRALTKGMCCHCRMVTLIPSTSSLCCRVRQARVFVCRRFSFSAFVNTVSTTHFHSTRLLHMSILWCVISTIYFLHYCLCYVASMFH